MHHDDCRHCDPRRHSHAQLIWVRAVNRQESIARIIAGGDVTALRSIVEGRPCACLGAVDGEELCRCKMNSKQVRDAVSYAGLKLGKLIRLKGKEF